MSEGTRDNNEDEGDEDIGVAELVDSLVTTLTVWFAPLSPLEMSDGKEEVISSPLVPRVD